MFSGIDFFSDTMTRPSLSMKQAMMDAALGDEQKGEDPTTRQLEERMAKSLGKSAAMFFPSATMCNQIAVNLHCQPGDEVIGAEASHIFNSEGGGAAFHSRAQARMIPSTDGTFDGDQVKQYARVVTSPHTPKSALVIVENTMNAGGGTVWPVDKLTHVVRIARDLGLKVHLDGARIWNAVVAQKRDMLSIAEGFSSVSVCFSKGLGCPTGAILAFDEQEWVRVRRLKQVFGGAMRQSGILAAACLYALDNHIEQLAIDHENAQRLAAILSGFDALIVETPRPQSNMVYFSIDESRMDGTEFLHLCLGQGLRFSPAGLSRFRAVTHRDVNRDQVEMAASILREILAS